MKNFCCEANLWRLVWVLVAEGHPQAKNSALQGKESSSVSQRHGPRQAFPAHLPRSVSGSKDRRVPHKNVVFAHRCGACTLRTCHAQRRGSAPFTLLQLLQASGKFEIFKKKSQQLPAPTSGASFCISRRSLIRRSVAALCVILEKRYCLHKGQLAADDVFSREKQRGGGKCQNARLNARHTLEYSGSHRPNPLVPWTLELVL
jgi:hypothetical protein